MIVGEEDFETAWCDGCGDDGWLDSISVKVGIDVGGRRGNFVSDVVIGVR